MWSGVSATQPAMAVTMAITAGSGTPNEPAAAESATNQESGLIGIEKPWVRRRATPRSTDRPASVTMKAGIPPIATNQPCSAPISPPSSSIARTTSGQGTPPAGAMAASALTSATVEPTDRSIRRW